MPQPPVQLVWFKRDLRVHDHRPLWEAAQRGPVLPLYIVEPDRLFAADFDPAHWTFIQTSLLELRDNLARLGQPLVVRVGEAVSVLDSLHQQHPIAQLWAHEETGNGLARRRDQAVRAWSGDHNLPFTEIPPDGVVRGLATRPGWANEWERRMRAPLTLPPDALPPVGIAPGRIPDLVQLRLPKDRRLLAQPGGESAGEALLASFLAERSARYPLGLRDPASAAADCSRLSPHLSYGTLSLRRVVQATRQRRRAVSRQGDNPHWVAALKAFESRLAWRCHCMQQLEDEPAAEFHNFVPALDGLREGAFDRAAFDAWRQAETGFPLIDAAMRCLTATGWLDARLRQLVAEFAVYDLWLHWREPALHLARLFLDYEPGIHYPHMQRVAGTAGLIPLRLDDPTQQARQRDPQGAFIRRWLPELAGVPTPFVHAPGLMPLSVQTSAGCIIGRNYPAPIVDHAAAAQTALDRLTTAWRQPEARQQAQAALEKHGGSRPPVPRRSRPDTQRDSIQLEFDWGDET